MEDKHCTARRETIILPCHLSWYTSCSLFYNFVHSVQEAGRGTMKDLNQSQRRRCMSPRSNRRLRHNIRNYYRVETVIMLHSTVTNSLLTLQSVTLFSPNLRFLSQLYNCTQSNLAQPLLIFEILKERTLTNLKNIK